jgi:FG-GAP-like repeat
MAWALRYLRVVGLIALAMTAAGTTAGSAYLYLKRPVPSEERVVRTSTPRSYISRVQVEYFCNQCHPYPDATVLPRSAWKEEVEQAYRFFADSKLTMKPPPIENAIAYFEDKAPDALAPATIARAKGPPPVQFQRTEYPVLPETRCPGISNVNLVHLFDRRRLDVLVCDMRAGLVLSLSPYAANPAWRILGHVASPAHAEMVDLDGDGINDVLVANLGSLRPTDERTGSVVWLRGKRDGTFTPVTLLDGIGRVADVQAADFRGVGKLDLVVAVFGWRKTGEVIYLENQTTDWAHPRFVPHVLDDRHGAIHVPVGDINGDGKPDFVALISQEHETIVAFLNEGGGRFRKETIYKGPHPAYGSTGIQLVDLNGDGKLDVLYTNGDSFEKPYVLKPYQGVGWLENRGRFPFEHHPIAPLYGAHRAVAADFRGTGRPDIVAVSYLPGDHFPLREQQRLDAVIYLEQTAPGQFARHTLEAGTCDHVTCVAGDIFGTGKIDLATGNLISTPSERLVTIWKNQGTQVVRSAAWNRSP